jgi:peptide/nickel transport system permease protein
MGYFLLRRMVGFVATLLTITVVVFAVMNVLPGDPALTILGIEASEAALEALRIQLGLHDPVVIRYLRWIGSALMGDFGMSHAYRVPVANWCWNGCR